MLTLLSDTDDVFVFEKFEVFFLNIYADFSAVAFYTIAFAISAKVMKLIPYSLTNIMLPIFTEKHSIGDTEGKHTVYTYSLKYLFIIIAPIFVGGVFISTELITNLYGIEFKPAADIFWITLLSSSIAAFFGSSASLLSAMEELSVPLTIGIISICLNIGMDLLLIPRYGIHGAAWANLIALVSGFLVIKCQSTSSQSAVTQVVTPWTLTSTDQHGKPNPRHIHYDPAPTRLHAAS